MTIREILKTIYDTNATLFRRLQEQRSIHQRVKRLRVSELYREVHREAAPCFILSTGRCGTKLLTNILGENPEVRVQHTPTPEFTHYAKFAYEKAATDPEIIAKIVDAARYEQIRDAYLLGKKYVETNNRITFFCYALAELYPESTFIHLVRKPAEFITSGLSRNWYSNSVLYDEGRLKPENTGYSQIEKIAWLWNETNSFIEKFKRQHAPERVMTIRSDDLFNSPDTVKTIFNFLKIPAYNDSKIAGMLRTSVNKQRNKKDAKEVVDAQLLNRLTPLRGRYFD